jgi:ABC-2 type transport system ATP-binding protein
MPILYYNIAIESIFEGDKEVPDHQVQIEAVNLTKTYRIFLKEPGLKGSLKHLFAPKYNQKIAVDNVNFSINKGESVAYIGANGAGKSTTIKMLTGILKPTSGRVQVCGLDPRKERIKNAYHIGAMFGQKSQLWWDIAINETFTLLKAIYEIPDDKYKMQLNFLIELLDMSSFIRQPARQLSLGQRVRADLAASFLHDPEILFLDEPTIGLDIMGKKAVRRFLNEVNTQFNKTILLTSHDLEDINAVSERVIIIDNGNHIYDGSITDMMNTYGVKKCMLIEYKIVESLPIDEVLKANPAILNISFKKDDDERIIVEYDPKLIRSGEILNILNKFGNVGEISISDESIEDVVEKLYLGKLIAPEA